MTGYHRTGIGVVGAGAAGRQHLEGLAGCADAVPVAICDSNADAAAALAAKHAAASPQAEPVRAATSLEDLLADDRVEVVALATPPGSHRELAVRALEAGRAVLLEKPPVLSTAELDTVLAAADARGLPAGVMLQHRFRLPAGSTAAADPWSPDTVASVEVVRYRPPQHYAKDAWRVDARDSGGGLVAHLGVHYLDLACSVLGMPAEVTSQVDTLPGTGIDQRVTLAARFESGARLSFIGSTGVNQRQERLAVYDSNRSLVIDNRGTVFAAPGGFTGPAPSTASLRTQVYSDMARAVRECRSPVVCDLASARGVVQLLEDVIARLPSPGGQP